MNILDSNLRFFDADDKTQAEKIRQKMSDSGTNRESNTS